MNLQIYIYIYFLVWKWGFIVTKYDYSCTRWALSFLRRFNAEQRENLYTFQKNMNKQFPRWKFSVVPIYINIFVKVYLY